jgi:hypothetical protein
LLLDAKIIASNRAEVDIFQSTRFYGVFQKANIYITTAKKWSKEYVRSTRTDSQSVKLFCGAALAVGVTALVLGTDTCRPQ